ncbi:DeoR/GlpR family DNA-binding transcription regulator [Chelativorans sp. M5D2P16]|uniref:DeoR/GlpR family DNA-binding transcription regulator n=1 Tax=Chelativorans sp. M5D2P16 TaxID=3095678 RepID=UPI002ACA979B|nr:DeoR/GlpR family DNA-binding transcription regulator [Chelativorans sp. M5D2P16]MDZ5699672.1 DeoR/GlpR family DNA-binding transcription regulator [Chelativorans sp. M5D2P16]
MTRLRKRDRQEQILLELRQHPHVRTSDLALRFGVSTETVRRDVEALSGKGLLRRAYGGAAAAPMGAQPPFGERDLARIDERARIGRSAAELVRPGEVLMIDAGSTTHQLALGLAERGRDLTILTNSLAVATALGRNKTFHIVLCPGDFMGPEAAVYGPETLDFLSRYNANRAFIGSSGLTAKGITDANLAAVAVKRTMIRQARGTFLLVDHSKFDVELVATVEPLSMLQGVVTDMQPPFLLREALHRANVRIKLA